MSPKAGIEFVGVHVSMCVCVYVVNKKYSHLKMLEFFFHSKRHLRDQKRPDV